MKEKKEKEKYDWICAWCNQGNVMPMKDFTKLEIIGSNYLVELPCSHTICNKKSYHSLMELEVRNCITSMHRKEVSLA